MQNGGHPNGDAGAPAIKMSTVPLMRSEAEQMEINQRRVDADLYQLRSLAGVQTQQQDFAEFMCRSMRRDEQKQADVIYNVYNGKLRKEPPPDGTPDPTPMNVEIQALQRKLEEDNKLAGKIT